MTVRVALLGCGRIAGYFHAPVLRDMAGVRVMAVADVADVARSRVGDMLPGAVRYADWRRAIDAGDIDAVVICLPPEFHAAAAIAAFEAGLSAYIEKPLALGLEEGEAVHSAWRAAGTVGAVGLNFRFHPNFVAIQRRIAAGELGEAVAVRALMTSPKRDLPGWKRDPLRSGGVLADLATHHVDLARFVTGHQIDPDTLVVDEVTGESGSRAVVQGRLTGGAHYQLFVSQVSGHGENRLEVLGTSGHLTADAADPGPRPLERPPGRFARVAAVGRKAAQLAPRALLHAGQDPSFRLALNAFVAAVGSGRFDGGADVADGLAALRVVDAAKEAASRSAIPLPAAPLEPVAAEAVR